MLHAVTDGGAPHVIGKGLAWELRLNHDIGDRDRLTELFDFIQAYTPGDIYPESWWDGGVSDAGNQEQTSWYVYEMLRMYPQLRGHLATVD